MIGIYKITNSINNKMYVGQAVNIERRFSEHKSRAFDKNSSGYNQVIHIAIRKYGLENFIFEVLQECSIEELDKLEKYWIKELNTISPNGYNILSGGQKYRVEPILCKECGNIISSKSNTHLCLNCYRKSLGAHLPDKTTLYNLLIENNGNFKEVGRLFEVSDNAIRKWCKKYGLKYHSSDYKQAKILPKQYKKSVQQIDLNTGEILNTFNSINDAARYLGKQKGNHITEVCKGIHKSAYGYGWKYI